MPGKVPQLPNIGMKKSSQKPPLVLVADENEDNLYLLTMVVQDLGFRSLAVNSGTAALQACKRRCPDLVLLETRFPGIHGYEIIAAIRRYHPRARISAIAVTSAAMPGDRAQCLNTGFDDYVAKPYSISTLERLIYEHIRHRKEYSEFSNKLSANFPDVAQIS